MRQLVFAMVMGLFVFGWGRAHAGASGSIVVTASQVDTSDKKFEAALKKAAVKSIAKSGDTWTIYFIAFLKKAAGATEVNLVFYDQGDKSGEPTNAFGISTAANAKILTSSISVGSDQGFQSGHTYDVRVTRLVGGKEDIYARTTLTLK